MSARRPTGGYWSACRPALQCEEDLRENREKVLSLSQILHIIGSPKGIHSASTRVAQAFIDSHLRSYPQTNVTSMDIWKADLPPFDGELALAKLAPIVGEERTQSQQAAWESITALIEEFDSFDKFVISTPMWNFGIPYKLKHYLDIIVQPGITFGVNAEHEHIGLLRDRPVQLVLTRSSPMPENSPEDFQLSYLQHILGFIGLLNVKSTVLEGTTLPLEEREKLVARECARVELLASDF